jgi:hypothetical protein
VISGKRDNGLHTTKMRQVAQLEQLGTSGMASKGQSSDGNGGLRGSAAHSRSHNLS